MSIAPSIGFDYSSDPGTDLSAWDWAVCDPGGARIPNNSAMINAKASGTVLLAYLNWSQVETWRVFNGKKLIDRVKKKGIPILGSDPSWPDEVIVDFSNPDWSALFLQMVDDAKAAGYRGVYFDNWPRFNDPKPGGSVSLKKKQQLMEATIGIAKTIRAKRPNWKLMVNTGWEISNQLKGVIDCILVESVWAKEDGTIRPDNDVQFYLEEIQKAQGQGHHVHLLEYTSDVNLAQDVLSKAEGINCGCTIVQGELAPAVYTLPAPPRSNRIEPT